MSVVAKCLSGLQSRMSVVLGAQWGDQGKGKLVDYLSSKYGIIARFNGGDNAGHTVFRNGVRFAFHLVPCGILSPQTKNILGNGCVINLDGFIKQLDMLKQHKIDYHGRIFISDRAHIITQYQISQDVQFERQRFLGTTKKGIGPSYSSKMKRIGLRINDLKNWNQFIQKFQKFKQFYPNPSVSSVDQIAKLKICRQRLYQDHIVVDGVNWINKQFSKGNKILCQGAHAALLDIDFGTYPYVTSSNTSIGGVATGLGIDPRKIETVIGVVKAYTTRVGQGPFPTELFDSTSQHIRKKGHQFGTTTGRPRRCGWLDLNLIKYTNLINGYDSINITKLDILDQLPQIKIAVQYKLGGQIIDPIPASLKDLKEVQVVYQVFKGWQTDTTKIRKKQDLPKQALKYLQFIQKHTKIPISWVGIGKDADAMIKMI